MSAPPRAHASAKQAFIGIDVANAVEKLLVEQSSFDWSFALMKQRCEFRGADLQRLRARPTKFRAADLEPAKPSRIDKAQLSSRLQFGDEVSVLGALCVLITYQHSPRHS